MGILDGFKKKVDEDDEKEESENLKKARQEEAYKKKYEEEYEKAKESAITAKARSAAKKQALQDVSGIGKVKPSFFAGLFPSTSKKTIKVKKTKKKATINLFKPTGSYFKPSGVRWI